MGLFDPPAVSIRKRIPSSEHRRYDEFADQAVQFVPHHLTLTQKGLMMGFIMAAWVMGERRRETMSLERKRAEFVGNMGRNCAGMLGEWLPVAIEIVEHFVDEGMIDPAPS